jgi:hypothetical protein
MSIDRNLFLEPVLSSTLSRKYWPMSTDPSHSFNNERPLASRIEYMKGPAAPREYRILHYLSRPCYGPTTNYIAKSKNLHEVDTSDTDTSHTSSDSPQLEKRRRDPTP